jgi:hypothetical protein
MFSMAFIQMANGEYLLKARISSSKHKELPTY